MANGEGTSSAPATSAAPRRGKTIAVLSSLPLQILFYLNGWYFAFLWLCEALMYIYKGSVLPYPTENLAGEWVLIFLLVAIEYVRLFLGKKGNLTEKVVHLAVSLALSVATLFGALYLILWQTYVLRAELILNAVLLCFLGLELVFSIIAVITFARANQTAR
ncbi:transmembrane protein 216-like isoform X1 [Lytechinus pictus]|uniref:transmembrane protein 216-like n=1 Tax=Lytechinus variegatus TaxID=7654 RepID=UPI001BB19DEB|nr:transmembrane protein 216-like [Lytechinus variegatus]XP_054774284.1 transmembrane protein 216-like [Lytechinus pictus]